MKIDLDVPDLQSPENLTTDAVAHFSIAFRCWKLLNSDLLRSGKWSVCFDK